MRLHSPISVQSGTLESVLSPRQWKSKSGTAPQGNVHTHTVDTAEARAQSTGTPTESPSGTSKSGTSPRGNRCLVCTHIISWNPHRITLCIRVAPLASERLGHDHRPGQCVHDSPWLLQAAVSGLLEWADHSGEENPGNKQFTKLGIVDLRRTLVKTNHCCE